MTKEIKRLKTRINAKIKRRVEKETSVERTLITDLSTTKGTVALISGREHQSKYMI